jgi:D-amino-acid dehydrogenase
MAADVVVVGAGVIGACVADALAGRGLRVTVLERGGSWGEGCSWGNAGLIVPSHARPIAAPENLRAGLAWMLRRDSPFGLRVRPRLAPWLARYVLAATPRRAAAGEALQRALTVESLERFRALAAEGLDGGFDERGCLTVFTGRAGPERAAHDADSQAGRALGARVVGAAEARDMEPALSRAVTAGVLFPREAQCDPVRLVPAIGRRAVARGAELRTGVDVRALRRTAGGIVAETSVGPVQGTHTVIAAGAWSARLARAIGVRLPLQGGRGYAAEFDPATVPIRRPLYLHDARCVATPMGDRVRITGGLILSGLDERHDPRRVAAIRRAAANVLGAASAPLRSWSGLRPCTPDGLPVIGAHPRAPEAVFATGHAMLGLALGPLTGAMVADLIAGDTPHPALARLSPRRFDRLGVRP